MLIQPYLSFEGRAEEAAEFYRSKLGAEIKMLMRFSEAPEQPPAGTPKPPGNKVMHMELRVGDSTVFLSDGYCSGKATFQGISLSLTAANEAEAKRAFDGLAGGGQVQMPLAKTFFSPSFGMVTDRFGVSWMVYVPQA